MVYCALFCSYHAALQEVRKLWEAGLVPARTTGWSQLNLSQAAITEEGVAAWRAQLEENLKLDVLLPIHFADIGSELANLRNAMRAEGNPTNK